MVKERYINSKAPSNMELHVTKRKPAFATKDPDELWVMAEDATGSGTCVAICGPDSPQSQVDAMHIAQLWNLDRQLRNSQLPLGGQLQSMVKLMVHRHLNSTGALKFHHVSPLGERIGFIRSDGACCLFGFSEGPVLCPQFEILAMEFLTCVQALAPNDELLAKLGDRMLPTGLRLNAWLTGH